MGDPSGHGGGRHTVSPGRLCVGCTACLTEGQLPLRNFQPLCEMTTDKYILLTSRLPVVPATFPSSEIWEPT